jgi:hypothetical protein
MLSLAYTCIKFICLEITEIFSSFNPKVHAKNLIICIQIFFTFGRPIFSDKFVDVRFVLFWSNVFDGPAIKDATQWTKNTKCYITNKTKQSNLDILKVCLSSTFSLNIRHHTMDWGVSKSVFQFEGRTILLYYSCQHRRMLKLHSLLWSFGFLSFRLLFLQFSLAGHRSGVWHFGGDFLQVINQFICTVILQTSLSSSAIEHKQLHLIIRALPLIA